MTEAEDGQGDGLIGLLIDVDAELARILDGLAVEGQDHILDFETGGRRGAPGGNVGDHGSGFAGELKGRRDGRRDRLHD